MYLTTRRLIIRDYLPSDWQDLLEIFSDPETMRQCEPVYDAAKTKAALAYFVDHAAAFAVTLADTGKVIGHALFHQLPGEEPGIYEIGWFFNRGYWRQGYAYEACKALLEYGFSHWNLHKICAETIDSVRSVGLMKKLGMAHEGTFRAHTKDLSGNWADLYWYAIRNPEEE